MYYMVISRILNVVLVGIIVTCCKLKFLGLLVELLENSLRLSVGIMRSSVEHILVISWNYYNVGLSVGYNMAWGYQLELFWSFGNY